MGYILFLTVALYGSGLPTFIHYTLEHQPSAADAAAESCCHHAHSCSSDDNPSQGDSDSENDQPGHECDVCDMLAGSIAVVVPAPALTPACTIPPTALSVPGDFVALTECSGPHQPRAPPAA